MGKRETGYPVGFGVRGSSEPNLKVGSIWGNGFVAPPEKWSGNPYNGALQGGPLPVINGVVTLVNGLING